MKLFLKALAAFAFALSSTSAQVIIGKKDFGDPKVNNFSDKEKVTPGIKVNGIYIHVDNNIVDGVGLVYAASNTFYGRDDGVYEPIQLHDDEYITGIICDYDGSGFKYVEFETTKNRHPPIAGGKKPKTITDDMKEAAPGGSYQLAGFEGGALDGGNGTLAHLKAIWTTRP